MDEIDEFVTKFAEPLAPLRGIHDRLRRLNRAQRARQAAERERRAEFDALAARDLLAEDPPAPKQLEASRAALRAAAEDASPRAFEIAREKLRQEEARIAPVREAAQIAGAEAAQRVLWRSAVDAVAAFRAVAESVFNRLAESGITTQDGQSLEAFVRLYVNPAEVLAAAARDATPAALPLRIGVPGYTVPTKVIDGSGKSSPGEASVPGGIAPIDSPRGRAELERRIQEV